MQCPECGGSLIRKNGKKQGKQNHICVQCGRQFIDPYKPHRGYSDEVKRTVSSFTSTAWAIALSRTLHLQQ